VTFIKTETLNIALKRGGEFHRNRRTPVVLGRNDNGNVHHGNRASLPRR
jgi:hypothetical protein